jgi:hypothetical protein
MANNPFDQPKRGPVIDMTADGQFRAPPPGGGSGAKWSAQWSSTSGVAPGMAPGALKLGGVAMLIAVVSGTLALAAIALWVAFMLVPIALAAGVIGWGLLKLQRWQARRAGPVDLYRR